MQILCLAILGKTILRNSMSPELEKILVQRYPDIFRDFGGDPSQTCMAFGLAVGDGWFDIIDVLCGHLTRDLTRAQQHLKYLKKQDNVSELELLVQEEKIEQAQDQVPQAAQVKEKFAGLRFYVNGATEEQYTLITMAESMSYCICEDCGNKGKVYSLGWHRTLCSPCAVKQYGQDKVDRFEEETHQS